MIFSRTPLWRLRAGVLASLVLVAMLILAPRLDAATARRMPSLTHAQKLQADRIEVNHFVGIETGLLHISAVPITVMDQAHVEDGDAVTFTLDAAGGESGPETHCEITFGSPAHVSPARLAAAASHEVFHCLSGELAPTLAIFDAHKKWLIEGAATWVDSDLVPDDPYAQSWWPDYLDHPERPLFQRTYDAVGFFGHLAQSGIPLWSRFKAMFSAPTDVAAYDASGAGAPDVLDSEASAFFGAPELGDDWTADHQGDAIADANVPLIHTVGETLSLTQGQSRVLTVKPYADGLYRLDASAPMTVITVARGQVRLQSVAGPEVDAQHITTLMLCRDGDACQCPDGSASAGPGQPFRYGDLAVAGGPGGASVTVNASCHLPPVPCNSLSMTSNFVAPSPAFEPDQVSMTSETGPDGNGGTVCMVSAPIPPSYDEPTPQPLGYWEVFTFATPQQADDLLTQTESSFSYAGTSPADVGDDAFVSPAGGGVVVDNDLFVFRWLPKTPGEESIDPASVLASAVKQLTS